MKNILVNGPINVVRLEGKVDGVDKVLYDMFDIHTDPRFETKCDDIRSYDIGRFLVKTFDELKIKSDKTYDLMFELYPASVAINNEFNNRYIDEVGYVFNKAIKIDTQKNHIQKSDELPNVRFHAVDIRDYVLNVIYDIVYKNIPFVINNLINNITIHDIDRVMDLIKILNAKIICLYKILYENKDIKNPTFTKKIFSVEQELLSKYSEEDYKILTEKYIYKLLKSYKNKNIHDKVLYIINNDFHNIFVEYFAFVDNTLLKFEKLKERMKPVGNYNVYDVLLQRENGTYLYGFSKQESNDYIAFFDVLEGKFIDFIVSKIGLYLMDLYLLRRFLDKNYITNTISYTGAGHSTNYVRLLIKYFDFKISHYSYIKNNDINNAHKIIKKSKNFEELKEIFYTPIIKQCSDLTNFPPLFE
jgi:hypothetical protein